jgi:hypothetical protein
MNGGDFASMLERAIERNGKARLIEGILRGGASGA